MTRSTTRLGVGALVLTVGVPTLCLAQAALAAPAMSRVTVTQVRPDMLNEWLDLQKNEVVPALKKAGVQTRTVFSSGLFGTAGEYVLIQPIGKFADFDGQSPQVKALGAQASARLGEKLRKCIVSSHSYLITRRDDLSNVTATPPPIIVTTRFRVMSGKNADFDAILKNEVLPVYKKANASLTVNARGLGGNPTEITVSTGMNKYSEMDGGSLLVKTLGQDGFARLATKVTAVSNLIEQVVRARVADLSF